MKKIAGNTYYIRGGTNTGIYVYNDKAIIIDPGLSGTRPGRIIKKIEESGYIPEYIINTHEHDDHYGGAGQIKDKIPTVKNCSSAFAAVYIENPILFPTYISGGKCCREMIEVSKLEESDITTVDSILKPGYFNPVTGEINKDKADNTIEIIELKGHTEGSLGFITPDGVFFAGDVLVGEEMLEKFDFLFTFDVGAQIESLEKLKNIDYEYMVLGHSKKIITKEESTELIEKNRAAMDKYINQIMDILKSPVNSEEILKRIINNNNLKHRYKEYLFFRSALMSILNYLIDNGKIEYILKDGELLYCAI